MSQQSDEAPPITADAEDPQSVQRLIRLLSTHGGTWKTSVVSPELVVLENTDEDDKSRTVTVLAGRITRGGHLLDVISLISTSRWSGKLVARDESITRELFFDQGALRMASSSDPSHRLGEVMVRRGKISREQLDQAVAHMGGGQRIGEILVQDGACTTQEVFELMHRQVEELFYAATDMGRGHFFFQEGLELGDLPAYMALDTNNLLMEGARRSDELRHFRKLIPGMRIVLKRKVRSFPPATVDAMQDEFLARCDGVRTLEQVADMLGLGEYEATRMAHDLLSRGELEVVPRDEEGDEGIRFVVDRFNDMIGVVNQALHKQGDPGRFLSEVRSYPSYGGEFEDFICQLELDDTGHLAYENVVSILAQTHVQDRMNYLVQVLTQYLFFVLFLAGNHLGRETHTEVSAEVHTMLQKIGE